MSLPVPNLDDRRFEDLLAEAKRRAAGVCPQWTDFTPHDPGVVLLELFAHLTELLIYRLNRVPEKAYVEFLNLMGVKLHPPVAASTRLLFSMPQPAARAVQIPRGTRVTVKSPDPAAPVFLTVDPVTIEAGKTSAEVGALHAELVEAEFAGLGTGRPGQVVAAKRPPLIASTGDELDLAVRVEIAPGEQAPRGESVLHNGKTYRTWREVEHFADLGDDRRVYVVDRTTGRISFAPAVRKENANGSLEATAKPLADVPGEGREIRLWYRRGGGPAGNVAAETLVTLKDPIAGAPLSVVNPQRATGGQEAETLANALARGPQEIHSLRRAVTARDFELLAIRNNPGAVARARAVTRAELWRHAAAGTVEVLLVPQVPDGDRAGDRVTAAMLEERETDAARENIQRDLDARRPLGTTCLVNWVRYKTVRVKARVVVVGRGEDPAAVGKRVLDRLYRRLNPLPSGDYTGWPFGETLRASHVFEIALSEPGVKYADRVRFFVDDVPSANIAALAADAFQPRTWYAGRGDTLFRSLNDGAGWEPAGRFAGETVRAVEAHPMLPGHLAVSTKTEAGEWRLHLSADCGETWPWAQGADPIQDMAWSVRDGKPLLLLLATEKGLRTLVPGEGPNPMLVADGLTSFTAVAAVRDERNRMNIAVAADNNGGVYLSQQDGAPGSFELLGLKGEDVRGLTAQSGAILWASLASAGADPGKGAFSLDLNALKPASRDWKLWGKGWKGGYCRSLAFDGSQVYAATNSEGVLRLDTSDPNAAWTPPPFKSGLPEREGGILQPVRAVAVNAAGAPAQGPRIVMSAGDDGVHRSLDGGQAYENAAAGEFETVTLPGTWLFCSGAHEIEARSEDEVLG